MSTASHRKVVERPARIPRIPWGFVLTGAALVALVGLLLVLLAAINAPKAKADTGYLKAAVTSVRVADFTRYLTTVNSSGMGINPAAIAAPATGPVGAARVAAATVDRGYVGNADRVTQWQRVLRHCKVVGCVKHVPAAMAHDMGIKHGQAYRVHFGDTTYVWVKLPHGRVRTITS